uniref:Putative fgf receptor activating protein n=1 Tax=Corethrella appendiculata TaxID=1370023 RepID=U5ENP0_9DIPT
MLPQYERLDENQQQQQQKKQLIKIKFSKFAVFTVSLPFFSFIFCVLWSIYYDFDKANATHCLVYNFLPSLSAAIGNYQPQRFIWQLAIIIHAPLRLIVVYVYKNYYTLLFRRKRRKIAYFACFLNTVENFALLGLSLWTSSENYEIHKKCFVTFIVTSEIYMLISYLLNRDTRTIETTSSNELKSIRYKRNLFIVNLSSIALAAYFFWRHNQLCEVGVYSLFALFEYIVVFTNMGFHMTAYWDFYNILLLYDWKYGFHITKI